MEPEVIRGSRNVLTPHGAAAYPGLLVILAEEWDEALIIPKEGQTIVARGGEHVYPYETIDGGHADGFTLRPGDRATIVRMGLAFELSEWHIVRAARVDARAGDR